MNALVTGANGFIGSHVCELLIRSGHNVRALVRRTSNLEWISVLGLELAYGDMREPDTLAAAVRGTECVFHAAAVLRPRGMHEFMDVNYRGTHALAEAAIAAGAKRFVLFSSAAAGGPAAGPKQPRTECEASSPVSLYGKGKLKAEDALVELRDRLHSVILRFPAVYGPRDRDVLLFLKCIRRGFMPDLGGTFSAVYVGDVARAALLAAERPVASGSVYYITDGHCYSYADMAGIGARLVGRRPLRVRIPRRALRAAGWASERLLRLGSIFNRDKATELAQECWACSSDKAHAELGFEAEYSLERGMGETFRWYRQMEWL